VWLVNLLNASELYFLFLQEQIKDIIIMICLLLPTASAAYPQEPTTGPPHSREVSASSSASSNLG
jgi:hypothetical protein